jgi:hypothetical protein
VVVVVVVAPVHCLLLATPSRRYSSSARGDVVL